jgi:hypothetical protein
VTLPAPGELWVTEGNHNGKNGDGDGASEEDPGATGYNNSHVIGDPQTPKESTWTRTRAAPVLRSRLRSSVAGRAAADSETTFAAPFL